MLLCVGKQPETLNSMIEVCKNLNLDLISLPEIGDLNAKLLIHENCYRNGTHYMNFYNVFPRISPKNIYVPLI